MIYNRAPGAQFVSLLTKLFISVSSLVLKTIKNSRFQVWIVYVKHGLRVFQMTVLGNIYKTIKAIWYGFRISNNFQNYARNFVNLSTCLSVYYVFEYGQHIPQILFVLDNVWLMIRCFLLKIERNVFLWFLYFEILYDIGCLIIIIKPRNVFSNNRPNFNDA